MKMSGLMKMAVVVVMFFSFTSLYGTYSGGNGVEGDPYQIATVADWVTLTGDVGNWDKQFILTADIDFGGSTISPVAPDSENTVGFQGTPFTGTINGADFSIKNFKISMASANYPNYAGLIGAIGTGGQVKNLGLENGAITGQKYVGSLCGSNAGIIDSCYATGTVMGHYYVGGLCGATNYGEIHTSYVTANVNAFAVSLSVGGLCGENAFGTITSCYATGIVTGVARTTNIGGFCGYNKNGVIGDCYSIGRVISGTSPGGFCGTNTGTVTNCFWDQQATSMLTSAGGTGLNTAQMQTCQTFIAAGWDYTDADGDAAEWVMQTIYYPLLIGCQQYEVVTVPDLRGLTEIQAQDALAQMKLNGGKVTFAYDAVTGKDLISNQSPLAGAFVISGSAIDYVISLGYPYSGGLGTLADPYRIAGVADWLKLINTAEDWSRNFVLTADIDFNGMAISVIAPDKDSPNSVFNGIPFTGTLDGAGFILRNFVISLPDRDYVGLFGCLGSTGRIINLAMENSTVQGYSWTGVLCGWNNSGEIENCHADGSVLSTGSYAGGLCGENSGLIEACHTNGIIDGKNEVGGLCGNNNGSIVASYVEGTVSGLDYGVGGLCGENYGSIFESYFSGTAYYKTTGTSIYQRLGGLCGYNYGTVAGCFSTGSVTGLLNSVCVGGLCGYNEGVISSCYSHAAAKSGWGVGGLCGANSGDITSCFADGNVSNGGSVGGLCGSNSEGTISMCYAGGAVSGASDYSGGLCAYIGSGTITKCYWNKDTTQQIQSAGGWGLTDDQMKQSTSFVGWNNGLWTINESMDYPHLVWENRAGDLIVTVYPARTYGGAGSSAAPYRITCREDLLSAGMQFDDWKSCFILTEDISLSGDSFTHALLGYGGSFGGVFDGDGHVISNSVIDGTNQDYVGFISRLTSGGIVKNLRLENILVKGHQYVGGLAGRVDAGTTISQCHTSGQVTGTYLYIGGLGGYVDAGNITSCSSSCDVNGLNLLGGLCGEFAGEYLVSCYATGTITASGGSAGGLCGRSSGRVSECFARGNVTGTKEYCGGLIGDNEGGWLISCFASGNVKGGSYVGGLTGYHSGQNTKYCYARGDVTGESRVGGLCGGNLSYFDQSYATGKVSGTGSYIGGLCGYLIGNSGFGFSFWDVQASGQSYSNGGSGKTTAQMQKVFTYSVNGWAGQNWRMKEGEYPRLAWEDTDGDYIPVPSVVLAGAGTLNNPWQIITVDDLVMVSQGYYFWDKHYILMADIDLNGSSMSCMGNSLTSFTGSFNGNGHVISNLALNQSGIDNVGLFGSAHGCQITNLGLQNTLVKGKNNIGGLCGYGQDCTIRGCYVSGSIEGSGYTGGLCGATSNCIINNCYTSGHVKGLTYSGGLCGYDQVSTMSNCYSGALVGGSGSTIGGLLGSLRLTKSSGCFWDKQATGQNTSAAGDGKTTVQMQVRATFTNANWDFSNTDGDGADWMIVREGVDYPRLAWQEVIAGDVAGVWGVDKADLTTLAQNWQKPVPSAGDIDQDGMVNLLDYACLSKNWLKGIIPDLPSPVGYWPMNNNVQDVQGANLGVLVNGATITTAAGEFRAGSGALKLDGVDDLVDCGFGPEINHLPVMSVVMWFKATEVPATRTMQLMGQRDAANHIWSLQVWGANSGHISGFVAGSTTSALTETAITPVAGQWYHVVMTYDDGGDRKVHIYVNGVEPGTVQQTVLSGTKQVNTAMSVTMGDRIGGGRAFGGDIDDIRIYRRVLTQSEIKALIDWADFKAYWTMDDDVRDSQGANHGVFSNGAAINKSVGEFISGSGALRLDGVDDRVNFGTGPDINAMPVMSVAMWIKATEVPAARTMQLMGQRDLYSHYWSLQVWGANSGHISGLVAGSTTNALTETAFAPLVGTWYHVAMTYDDNGDRKVHIYVNGVEAGTVQQTALGGMRYSNTVVPVTIGDRIGGGRALGGNIDDVRIYRRVLTEAEIKDLAGGM